MLQHAPMKLVSVNVGLPTEIQWQGKTVRTSIFKSPVSGPVHLARLNLDGDQQSDLTVHGGVDKAVYVYPSEHYPFWRTEFPTLQLSWGALGENFTTQGVFESDTNIGDRLSIGSAELIVTQPRLPCFKLGIRFQSPGAIKVLLQSGKTGFYLKVAKEGVVAPGDSIGIMDRDKLAVTVSDIVKLYSGVLTERRLLHRATELSSLPVSWRDHFRKRMAVR
jgi:MOSC domain-containing protein YiiM